MSTGGALVELQEWMRPGTRTVLKLSRPAAAGGGADRMAANGRIVRCWVDRLAPLRYRAAMVFAEATPAPTSDAADLTVLLERPA
ncbi:MAG: hypothetical protein R2708_26230 [Vicinamibacterales bacterium]